MSIKPFDTYPGSKGGAGVAQQIISLMPAHRIYVELFLGGGAIYLRKRLAVHSYLVDKDSAVVAKWSDADVDPLGTHIIQADSSRGATWPVTLVEATAADDCLIYADPPYLRSVVTENRYAHRFDSDEDHRRLIELLRSLPCMVMLSGYRSDLYDELLSDWRRVDFSAGTRGGRRIESVWMNFPDGLPLHDTRFLGRNRHDRERIRRKRDSWKRRLEAMHPHERQVIQEALQSLSEPAS